MIPPWGRDLFACCMIAAVVGSILAIVVGTVTVKDLLWFFPELVLAAFVGIVAGTVLWHLAVFGVRTLRRFKRR